jgi:lipopolysaccharide biosynthesis regulator YciM
VAKVDSQTVELHFALGNLFRRRGETERAIRMHQNLIDLPDLDDRVRLQALSELGQDYLKAGLLDRAEEIFNKLLGTDFEEDAKRNLLEIYQVEKEWLKAIEIARELPDVASHREIAEYYCELAANEIMRSRPDSAREYLEVAMQENRKCVRASLLQGDLLLQEGKLSEAIEAWQRIEQQDPAYLALVAQRLLETYRKLERPTEGIALLSGYLERYPFARSARSGLSAGSRKRGYRGSLSVGARRVATQSDPAWPGKADECPAAPGSTGGPSGCGTGKIHHPGVYQATVALSVR